MREKFPPIRVEFSDDGRTMTLLEPVTVILRNGLDVTAKAGFQFDGASVPRVFWNILPPWGPYLFAALIHDWLYKYHKYPRYRADDIFLELLERLDIDEMTRRTMYNAVKMAGKGAYRKVTVKRKKTK